MTLRKLLCTGAAGAAALLVAAPAMAQDRYLGQIIPFTNTFCPKNTIEANGQILPIQSNAALFSLFGTQFGGNGSTNFALPDLRGRAANGPGQGPGLSPYVVGQNGGAEYVQLDVAALPSHTHAATMQGYNGTPDSDSPNLASVADFPAGQTIYNNNATPNVQMQANSVQALNTGNNSPVPLNSPYVTIRYCVVMSGIFPQRP